MAKTRDAVRKYQGFTECTKAIAVGQIVITNKTKVATDHLINPMSKTLRFFIFFSKYFMFHLLCC